MSNNPKMMIKINANNRLVFMTITFLLSAAAQTRSWTAPVVLSTGGQGWEAAAAIDGSGNSVALWDERTTVDQLWSRSKQGTGAFGSVTEVSPALESTSVLPVVRASAAGLATAVWSDQDGVWTADRPAGSNWGSPRLLIPGATSPIFVMDSQGDAAVVWTVGGPSSASTSVMAVLRPSGGAWTGQQIVSSGAHVVADHAGIADNGAVVVTWETYTAVCRKYGCSVSAFDLHASRQNKVNDRLARLRLVLSGARCRLARRARGARFRRRSDSGGDQQRRHLQLPPPRVTPAAAPGACIPINRKSAGGLTITTDLASDDAGQVTLVYEFIGFSTSQVFAVNGSISNNTWSAPAIISGGDMNVGNVYFAVSPAGTAVAVWMTATATPEIHAIVRSTATGAWSSPVAISGPGSEINPEAAAVSSSGNAIVIYSGYDASSVHTEYVTNYQP